MTKPNALASYLQNFSPAKFCIKVLVSIVVSLVLVMHAERDDLKILVRLEGFFPALLFTAIASLTILEYVHIQNRILTKDFRWEINPLKRLVLQILRCIAAPLFIAFVCATIYFWYYDILVFDTRWFSHYFLPISLLIFILNLLYLAKDAFLLIIGQEFTDVKVITHAHHEEVRKTSIKKTVVSPLLLSKNVKDVCLIKNVQGVRLAYLKNGEQFAWPFAIEASLIHLQSGKYLEINRKEIVAKWNIAEISETNRDFYLILKHPSGTAVKVSQRFSDDHRLFFHHLKSKLKNVDI
jgi:hypothetical protein